MSCDDGPAPEDADRRLWRCPLCDTFERVAAIVDYMPADEADGLDRNVLLGTLFGADEAIYGRAWDQFGGDD